MRKRGSYLAISRRYAITWSFVMTCSSFCVSPLILISSSVICSSSSVMRVLVVAVRMPSSMAFKRLFSDFCAFSRCASREHRTERSLRIFACITSISSAIAERVSSSSRSCDVVCRTRSSKSFCRIGFSLHVLLLSFRLAHL